MGDRRCAESIDPHPAAARLRASSLTPATQSARVLHTSAAWAHHANATPAVEVVSRRPPEVQPTIL
jgi:hypothetical protein